MFLGWDVSWLCFPTCSTEFKLQVNKCRGLNWCWEELFQSDCFPSRFFSSHYLSFHLLFLHHLSFLVSTGALKLPSSATLYLCWSLSFCFGCCCLYTSQIAELLALSPEEISIWGSCFLPEPDIDYKKHVSLHWLRTQIVSGWTWISAGGGGCHKLYSILQWNFVNEKKQMFEVYFWIWVFSNTQKAGNTYS